ncbi:hypothetical protein EYF80_061104 [Liparis tanakae]|uniref:Uncharacterized protein n=1 Tax=Liparis tanakae TaxID=230148 RepID=A0A4Z2EIW6_9TELE|nr:hypothetical protein EYF80_061104 [Liparis tanakae]
MYESCGIIRNADLLLAYVVLLFAGDGIAADLSVLNAGQIPGKEKAGNMKPLSFLDPSELKKPNSQRGVTKVTCCAHKLTR